MQTWLWAQKYQYFIGFYRFFEKSVAVAAAALMGGPSRCSHSITFFFWKDWYFQRFNNIFRQRRDAEVEEFTTSL